MKGKRIRYQQTGKFHFLTFSCYHRQPYLSTAEAMDLFEDALERVRRRYRFEKRCPMNTSSLNSSTCRFEHQPLYRRSLNAGPPRPP